MELYFVGFCILIFMLFVIISKLSEIAGNTYMIAKNQKIKFEYYNKNKRFNSINYQKLSHNKEEE